MAVYVDDMFADYQNPRSGGRMKMCHMIADTRRELMDIAKKIGMRKEWLQRGGTPREHFDVSTAMRRRAVALGAVEVSVKELVRINQLRDHDTYMGKGKIGTNIKPQ